MRVDVSFTGHRPALQILESLGDEARPILARAANRAMQGMRTDASKAVREVYNIKARSVRDAMSFSPASQDNLAATMQAVGGRTSLIHFSARPSRPPSRRPRVGVSVQVTNRRYTIPGTFVPRLAGGGRGVFWRSAESRLPIEKLTGPSVPQMLGNPRVTADLTGGVLQRFDVRVEHEVDRYLKKKGLR